MSDTAGIFKFALSRTLEFEGGWYDGSGAHDPNPTMKGITQKTYDAYTERLGLPKRSVRHITNVELEAIYEKGFWAGLPKLLAEAGFLTASMVLFDHQVNAGREGAAKVYQITFNRLLDYLPEGTAERLTEDGVPGKKTLASVAVLAGHSLPSLWVHLVGQRFLHYLELSRSQRLRPNLHSWMNRLAIYMNRLPVWTDDAI